MEDTKRAFISYSSPGLILTGLFAVFQVEVPGNQGRRSAHRVVVDSRRAGAELRLQKVVDHCAHRAGIGECCELIAEFEVVEDASCDMRRKPVEVVLEIGK